MAASAKDTIYIDVDDEITAIIDKVVSSKSKVTALVLPKRAAALQSVVNMKLLKRAAENAKKHVVLITSEANLLPLAGSVGLYVAKNLQSRPAIPDAPEGAEVEEETAELDDETEDDAELDKDKTIDELDVAKAGAVGAAAAVAAKKSAAAHSAKAAPEEVIELDNDTPADSKTAKASKKKPKTKGGPKIPNFESFRAKLFIGIGIALVLFIGVVFALIKMPKATVTIKTDTTTVDNTTEFTAQASAESVDAEKKVVPAETVSVQRSDTQTSPATGQKDKGAKATGTMTITNCSGNTATLPAGTTFTADGLTFTSDAPVSVPKSSYDFVGFSFVCNNNGKATVAVTAQSPGANFNVDSKSYQIGGSPTNVSAKGSSMSGGTSNIVKVVTQADVDTAKAKSASMEQVARDELTKQLKDQGFMVLNESFAAKDITNTPTPAVGSESDQVSVVTAGTYTLTGIKESDLKKVLDESAKEQIDENKQKIQDYGLTSAKFKVTDPGNGNDLNVTIDTVLVIGPDINQDQLKSQITGKKQGESEQIIKALPGVKDAEVKYSPFWVSRAPKPAKITIILEKAN